MHRRVEFASGPHTHMHTHTQGIHTVRWIATPPRINTYQLQWAGALCSFLLILSMVIYCSVLVNSHTVPRKCGRPREIVEFKAIRPGSCPLYLLSVHSGPRWRWIYELVEQQQHFAQRGMSLWNNLFVIIQLLNWCRCHTDLHLLRWKAGTLSNQSGAAAWC